MCTNYNECLMNLKEKAERDIRKIIDQIGNVKRASIINN